MNAADAQRLLEEQTATLHVTQQRTDQLKQFKDDYKALQERLETLPDKLTHDVMVPFGKLAFMPGQLVHTNEVLVLLGDNWFAERSAKQACDIINRRVEVIDKQLSDLDKQRGLLEPRRQFTEDLWDVGKDKSGAFEIREEYDEANECQWKKRHRENLLKYRQEQKAKAQQAVETKPKNDPLTDAEMWARLDELEEKEMKDQEMQKLDEELTAQAAGEIITLNHEDPREQIGHRVNEEEEEDDEEDYDTEDEEDSDDYEDDDTEDETDVGVVRPASIRFSHTITENAQALAQQQKPLVNEDGTPQITSPSDIYTHFMPAGPKSILKSPGEGKGNGQKHHVTIKEPEAPPGGTNLKAKKEDLPSKPQPVQVGAKAFTGAVVEREDPVASTIPYPVAPAGAPQPSSGALYSVATSPTAAMPSVAPAAGSTENASKPRVSRFKAQRMKQHNR